jgi:hypothetical protein
MNAQASSANLIETPPVSEAQIESSGANVRPNGPIIAHPSNGNSNSAPALAEPAAVRSEQLSPNYIPTDFEEFPDGTLVELVQGPASLGLLVWSEGKASIVEQFEHDGRLLIPPAVDQKFCMNLRLPEGVGPCPATAQFFAEICEVVRSTVDLPESSIRIVVAFALSTWFVDNLAVAPYLWICGPPGSGKTTLMRLLHCLCRRAVLTAGTIPSQVYSLPALLRPTLLLDELQFNGAQHSHALESWLRAGNARGVPVTVGGRLVDSFGAKVLCSRQPASDTALSSRALHISMVPTRSNLQALDEETVERMANDFQPRLLMFRLQHYQEFRPQPLDLSPLSPRIADLARALVLPLRGVEKETLAPIFDAMVEQANQASVERAHEPEALVVSALFGYCHGEESTTVLVGQIASQVNLCRRRIGEEADLKPRAVGSILKSLGLATDKVDSFGRGLHLTVAVKRRIHQLLQIYNLKATDPARIAECVLCDEMMRTRHSATEKV